MGEEEIDGLAAEVDCCIVGAGPAGALLALMLARQGVRVALLEAHGDFERQFRGDALQPSALEILDDLGLADRLLALPHAKNRTLTAHTPQGVLQLVDLSQIDSKFPFVMLMPQARFLDFLIAEAGRWPGFQLVLHARVEQLIETGGRIAGVRYRQGDRWREIRAPLTVGADGRFSRVRQLAGLAAVKHPVEQDLLWLRVARHAGDPSDGSLVFAGAGGESVVALNRDDHWQIGYMIRSGSFQELRAAGADALRQRLRAVAPLLAARFDELPDWGEVAVLRVESNRLKRWHRPGLLMIGDAAHTMSPLGGVGVNYALQDAVVTANLLGAALKRGAAPRWLLARVQLQRELPIRVIQTLQTAFQRRAMAAGTTPRRTNPGGMPWLLRAVLANRLVKALPSRLLAFGLWRVRVRQPASPPVAQERRIDLT